MMLSPYQHGIVREIIQHGHFDPSHPNFQDYPFAAIDRAYLINQLVIVLEGSIFKAGPNFVTAGVHG